MTRLRCIDCRALLAAFDVDYDPTSDDLEHTIVQMQTHAKRAGCSGMATCDFTIGDTTINAVIQ